MCHIKRCTRHRHFYWWPSNSIDPIHSSLSHIDSSLSHIDNKVFQVLPDSDICQTPVVFINAWYVPPCGLSALQSQQNSIAFFLLPHWFSHSSVTSVLHSSCSLHHLLERFPPFSEYQDVFSALLTMSTFVNYSVPSWIPQPPPLLKIAEMVYSHWQEQMIEWGGHRIVPTLNVSYLCNYLYNADCFQGDKSDTLSEFFI